MPKKTKKTKEIDLEKVPYFLTIIGPIFYGDYTWGEKSIYAFIAALTKAKGYCFASNKYIADILGVSERTVIRAVSRFVEKGFLRSVLIKDINTKMIVGRRLYITTPAIPDGDIYVGEKEPDNVFEDGEDENNKKTPSNPVIPMDKTVLGDSQEWLNSGGDKDVSTYRQRCQGGGDKDVRYNVVYNNVIDNNAEFEEKKSLEVVSEKQKETIEVPVKEMKKKKAQTIGRRLVNENSPYFRIMAKFNSLENTRYKYQTKEFIENIDELLEVYSEEEILEVVEYIQQDNYNPQYYKPSVIFRPKNFNKSFEFAEKKKKACGNQSQASSSNKQLFYFYYNINANKIVKSPIKPSNPKVVVFSTEEEAHNHAVKNNLFD